MYFLKKSYLLLSLTAALSACGGSGSENNVPVQNNATSIKSISLEQMALDRPATWHVLENASTSGLSRLLNSTILTTKPMKLANPHNASLADGVLMHLDSMPLDWKAKIKQALNSGQSVVIESAGTEDGITHLEKVTLDLMGFTTSASAVLIVPNEIGSEIYSIFPFEPEKMDDLVKTMTLVYKRSKVSI